MSTKFILSVDSRKPCITPEQAEVIDACNFSNWLRSCEDFQVYYTTENIDTVYDDLRMLVLGSGNELVVTKTSDDTNEFHEFIPVGSVDFVNRYLEKMGLHPMMPINVPEELRSQEFTGRFIGIGNSEYVKCLVKEGKRLVIKSHTSIKKYPIDYVDKYNINKLNTDDNWFVSDYIDEIDAEWRVFVKRGEIVDIKQYAGYNDSVDENFVNKCIKAYRDCPRSYTLDIGKIGDKYVVIEVHNFVSCGLYGFSGEEVLTMLRDGWKFEITNRLEVG